MNYYSWMITSESKRREMKIWKKCKCKNLAEYARIEPNQRNKAAFWFTRHHISLTNDQTEQMFLQPDIVNHGKTITKKTVQKEYLGSNHITDIKPHKRHRTLVFKVTWHWDSRPSTWQNADLNLNKSTPHKKIKTKTIRCYAKQQEPYH